MVRGGNWHELMSDMTVVRDAPEKQDEFLGVDEIIAALDALSPDDKLKLGAIEAKRRGGTEFGPGELIQEAVCRALERERNCPRDVPFMAFLAMTMKSIASHSRSAQQKLADSPELATGERKPDGHADPPTPEDSLLEKEAAARVQTIHGHFEDDSEAQLVLMGWGDGLRGKELREATGLDQAALDYAGKRIRMKMRKLYPDGWTS